LREHPQILERPLVAIAPGAKREPNRWPAERFAEVAAALCARGSAVVTLGGPGDATLCAQVASAAGVTGLNLAGRTSILESCEVLKRCRLLICNDSGVQHLAAAVGTPCVSIFSFRDFKGRWFPHGSRNVVLQKWVPCAVCLLESCPRDNLCLRLITSSEVIENASAQLG
jgi:ADP-heptose:LPS heptosyltransferase